MNLKNRKLNTSVLVLLGVLLAAVAFLADRGASPTVANASAPIANAPVGGSVAGTTVQYASHSAPNTAFSDPAVVSVPGQYDNFPGIAASPLNGAITVAWSSSPDFPDDPSGVICVASNGSLGLPTSKDCIAGEDNANVKNQNGPGPIVHDNQGRRHFLYWLWPDYGTLCSFYGMVDANGAVVRNEQIPGTCDGVSRKLLSLSVDSNYTVHIALGKDNVGSSLEYYERLDSGVWSVVGESIPTVGVNLGDVSIATTTSGQVMVAYKDTGNSGTGYDIYTAKRTSAFNWTVEDISSACCSTCPGTSKAYLPSLYPSPDGGLRIVWADGRCGDNDTDIYYREWHPGTGWDGTPIVRVVFNSGTSYYPSMAVDASGLAHIVWGDTTSSPVGYYRVFYSEGSGTSFSSVQIPFQNWSGNAWQRDTAIDYADNAIHIAFSSIKFDRYKDNFYSYSITSVPPPTSTPTATSTPTPPCGTETGLDFQDVCHGDTFYTNIHNIYLAGIMTGYTCGSAGEPCGAGNLPYFRPGNNTTRGQMAKIVVLAAGLTISAPDIADFEDVPNGSTFYNYVETAFANGVITGYPCGGAGEPCDSQNRPYFRPASNVTRGQLSKMVSVAFNFTENASGQSFQDVSSNNPFYIYVQRLSARGIIGGYACGSPVEPCVPPGNLPYFRPGNLVTRGQTAKIVDLSRQQPTPTPSPTSTNTPTAGPTNTATETSTPNPSGTATDTPVVTTTPTATLVVTNTPGTDTVTPTVTSTPTITATPTP